MSSKRKHVSFLRTAGSLLLAAGISYGMLLLVDLWTNSTFGQSALTPSFYVLAGISALFVFLLLVWPANWPLRKVKVFLRWLVLVVGLLMIWAAGSGWNLQNQFLYKASAYQPASEEQAGQMNELEAVSVKGKQGNTYKGWLWKHTPQQAPLVMYFGGNAEFSAETMRSLASEPGSKQLFQGYHVLMMDYPGYGQSTGVPTEQSIYDMALDTWAQIAERPDVNPDKIVLMGWSLGTGTAARLAAEKQPAGLILTAPFYDGVQLVGAFLKADISDTPLKALVRNKYHSNEYANATQTKALIIAAENDQMIPAQQAQQLAKEYAQHELVVVPGGHAAAKSSPQAVQAMHAYLQQVLGQ